MKKLFNARRGIAGTLAVMMALSNAQVPVYAQTDRAERSGLVGKINLDPQTHYQTLEGWGTSLCWWGNVIGSASTRDTDKNGIPDREDIAKLAFSPDYLNLNIVRYNVGGGDKPDSSIKRVEGRVPGWSIDMYGADNGRDGSFQGDAFYNKPSEDMNDAGQIWMLEQANQHRKDSGDIINEVFSNSPPYYMTKSGSSTGGYKGDRENLRWEDYDEFTSYLAYATKWLDQRLEKKFETGIDYVEPLNEPDTDYWYDGSTKQEGCIFGPGESQNRIYDSMKRALADKGLEDVKLTGTDETSLWNAKNSFEQLNSDVKNSLSVIGAHTYSGNDEERVALRKMADSYDKPLWMSEITRGGGTHNSNSHESMWDVNAKDQSRGIMSDLKTMGASAWIAWLVADSEYECLQTNSSWGLMHYVFEDDGPVRGYHDNLLNWDGSKKDGVPEAGYWAVTKQFYTMMQYSKYLKAGYTMVEIDDGNMCAAVSPDRKEMVIVAQNFESGSTRNTSVDLHALPAASKVELYRTSDVESCQLVSTETLANKVLNVSLPDNSVSTYVITAEDGKALYDNKGYKQTVDCDVQTTGDTWAAGASDHNKFTYNGDWGFWDLQKYTSSKDASADFVFTGTHAALYGKKSSNGADLLISVDDGEEVLVKTNADQETRRSLLYTTPMQDEGKHTVHVRIAEDQPTAEKPELVLEYAEIIHGALATKAPVITDIAPQNGQLIVLFEAVEGVTEYTVECGTTADTMTNRVSAENGMGILTGLTNGTDYYVCVKGSDGSSSVVEKVKPAAPAENLVYFVNAGTGEPYDLAEGESFGEYNSVLDQAYGKDTVTGKNWGYVGDTSGSNSGDDMTIWDSVRYDNQDAVGKGVVYEFELDPGEYFVEIGMDDPWNYEARKQQIVLQGETKDTLVPEGQVAKKYSVTVAETGKLTLEVVRPEDNTDEGCDPLLNWIKVEKIIDDELVSLEELSDLVTVKGVVPVLPYTVKGETASGESERTVKWSAVADTFQVNNYTTVKVTGEVEGSALKASVNVLVVPKNLQYFVDCNNVNSSTYANLDQSLDLLNPVADQGYKDGSWGYLENYDTHDGGTDRFNTGWVAGKNQPISYQLPLEAGSYQLDFGFQEWWPDSEPWRPMKVEASYQIEGEETITQKLCDVWLSNSNPVQVCGAELTLPQDALVTFSVLNTGEKDALLSFFGVQKTVDHSQLISALGQARTLDRSKYSADSLTILDAAVIAGHGILTAANATKEDSDNAARAITDAITALGDSTEFTEEELIANDYVLYLANCGTDDPTVVPDGYRMGLLQSTVDQQYDRDAVSGKLWGYAAPDENSRMDKNGDDPSDITDTCVSMASDVTFDRQKSGFKYAFTLPARDYEVTVGFKNPWSGRNVNIQLEGETAQSNVYLPEKELVEKRLVTRVTDGELNVMVHSPERGDQYGDPILSYIMVKAVPEYTLDMLQTALAELDTVVEDGTWYESEKTAFLEVRENIAEIIAENPTDETVIREAYMELQDAFSKMRVRVPYTSFTGINGDTYYDTNGAQIQAHGGQIQQLTVDGETKYYWIGEDKTNDYRPVGGIHLYTSDDLYDWKDEGVVLRTMESMDQFETDPYFKELYADYDQTKKEETFIDLDIWNCVMERPKMIYNEKTDKYVIWFHADGRFPGSDADYGKAKGGVAISDSPTGPFKLLGSYKLNYSMDPNTDRGYDGWDGRGSLRDMNLFVDDDKSAYIVYSSEGNRTMFVSKLNDDYTNLVKPNDEAVEGVDFTRNFVGWSREAPAMFQYKDKYYVVTSGCTGWSPNQAKYAVADHPMGPWTEIGDPCNGWGWNTTFDTQPTCVFPVDAENGKYIYMGDRWNAGDLSESRYVWLPVEFKEDNRLVLNRYSNWTLEELDNKGLPNIETEIPDRFESLAELKAALPETVDVRIGGELIQDAAINWDGIDTEQPFLGEYKMYGTLTERNIRVSHNVNILNSKTQYFFDSGAESSEYFEMLKEQAPNLKNEQVDQAYTAENRAGYLGERETDFDVHGGYDLYGDGLWAMGDKVIEYGFDLIPGEYTVTTGYQEWWQVERGIQLSTNLRKADGSETELAAKTFTLGQWDWALIKDLTFTVPDNIAPDSSIVIRVKKTGSSDPVLSYISVVPTVVPETTFDIAGTVTGEETDEVEDITINLYEGDITIASASDAKRVASPSNAVKTDAEGTYRFAGLNDGIYSVELPAGNGYKQDVKVVEVNGEHTIGIDLALVKEGEEEEGQLTLKIKTLPDKISYWLGEELDPTGLEVALYQDGLETEVLEEEEYTLSDLDTTTTGRRKITVTYVNGDGEEAVTYDASFTVTVYEKPDSSIKIVKKPYKLSYMTGEEFDSYGMVVRGLNIMDEPVLALTEEDYEVEYDFTEAGTAIVTVIYTMEDQGDLIVELNDSFEVRVFDEEESRRYVEQIQIAQKPNRMVYEIGEDFEPEGMTVEKTVRVVASSSNASYKETIPLDELEIEQDDFFKTGSRKVKILYYAEGKDGEETEFPATLTVTVSKSEAVIQEGNLTSVKKKLEQDLLYGEYLTKEEKQTAIIDAVDSAKECMDVGEESGKISTKVFELLKDIEQILLKNYENITTSVKADSRFEHVSVDGLALSADLTSEKVQRMQLQMNRSKEEIPVEITDAVSAFVAMDILLHNGDSEMQPELPIRIRMDIPAGLEKDNLVIYHYHDGEWSTIVPVVSGGQMSFIASNLSVFVAANTKEQPKPSNPDYDDDDGEVSSNDIAGTWKKDDIGWWYQKRTGGYISSAWAQIKGQMYYFDDRGYMKTGWVLDKTTWYYLKDDGSMATGMWILTNEKWYYVTRNGDMAVNASTPDGYRVGGDGVWIK